MIHTPHVKALGMMLDSDKAIDLDKRELYVLGLLCEVGPLRVIEATQHLGLSASRTSRIMNGLVRDGYVQRTDNNPDMRIIAFAVTDKGRKLNERIRTHMAAITEGENGR